MFKSRDHHRRNELLEAAQSSAFFAEANRVGRLDSTPHQPHSRQSNHLKVSLKLSFLSINANER